MLYLINNILNRLKIYLFIYIKEEINDIIELVIKMFFRRKAILMIHGFVGGTYDYGMLPTELELVRRFDVYTFTLPGHEKLIVKDVKHTDWIKAAEDQIELLIKNHYKTIYVIGHSMGGVIAAHLAAKYKQVKKLVLAAPAFRYFYFKEGKVNIKGFNETIKNMPNMFKNMGTEKVLERIAKTPIPTMLEFTKLVNTLEQDVKNITCPVLTIRGTLDKVVPYEGVDYVYNNLNTKTNILYNIKDVTHDCFTKQRSEELNLIIKTFLKKNQRRKKEIINI